ncbi:MAG: carboxypeptidase M32 [Bacteroidota bacterium]
MPTTADALADLRARLDAAHDLQQAAAVLEWDQETYMPDGAVEARARQLATLHRLHHETLTDDVVQALLDRLTGPQSDLDPHSVDGHLVRVAARDVAQAVKIPGSLVADLAQAVARGKQAWKEARATDTFATFAPALARILELNIRKAEALGYEDQIYDALLDQYEPGMPTQAVTDVFEALRPPLVALVEDLAAAPPVDDALLRQRYPEAKQWDVGMAVLQDIGYDFNRGRQDRSAHPFTTSFSVTDVRITTRFDEHYLPTGLFGTLHEAGHGLYEQGIDASLAGTLLAEGTSLALHESQSRLWENLVGRSRPFWQHYYPKLQAAFPDQLRGVPFASFYRAINRVEPSLIRVEADEVTYNLHIMLRFELEVELVEGRLAVADLPEAWNDRMATYLGLTPPSDADGVLQDVHWALGAVGYFPTYALGNLMSAQLFTQIRRDQPSLDADLAAGRFAPLLTWLQTHVHRPGRTQSALEIMERLTGGGLSAEPWLAYVRSKYEALYAL